MVDADIQQTLLTIKLLLYVFLALALINTCFGGMRLWLSFKQHKLELAEKFFQKHLQYLVDENRFDDLIKHCEERLEDRANDPNALWYLGKAYYSQRKYSEATAAIRKLMIAEPSWTATHSQPMLDAIELAENGATKSDSYKH